MEHKGYTCTAKFDEGRKLYHGKVVTPQGTFQLRAPTMEQLTGKFKMTVDEHLARFSEDLAPRRYPPLRRKLFVSYLILILIMALGVAGLLSVLSSASDFPRQVVRRNYDSIMYAAEMRQAWYTLSQPRKLEESEVVSQSERFEDYLSRAERNITESREPEILGRLRSSWSEYQRGTVPPAVNSAAILSGLDELVKVNEKGMLTLVDRAEKLWQRTLRLSAISFGVASVLIMLFAYQLASRVSRPIREIGNALKISGIGERPPLADLNPETEEVQLVQEALEMRFITEAVDAQEEFLEESFFRMHLGQSQATGHPEPHGVKGSHGG
jgi:hypothetical protein